MANNRIGCSSGNVNGNSKTYFIDPNNKSNDGINNTPIQHEDLNISVVLRTYRKGRTVLQQDSNNVSAKNTTPISINFIEGSQEGNKKSITTKYTNLTTIFEDGVFNNETLGITSIDIDFNPSMAPMININFIDVRGSSIFQNDNNLNQTYKNQYSTFFQLPYPIFELQLKGYYGLPVTYCLHLLKFTSKFNSQTGNFEIQCQFVGYTYAMLSDMLLGYLKAIPHTKIGDEIYKKYDDERLQNGFGKILRLNELMAKISEINNGVTKLAGDSGNSQAINTVNDAYESIDNIKGVLIGLGLDIGLSPKNNDISEYSFIIKDQSKKNDDIDKSIVDYKDKIKNEITKFNNLNVGIKLDETYFYDISTIGVDKGLITNVNIITLNDNTFVNNLSQQINNTDSAIKTKDEINVFIKRYYEINETFNFDVYNLTFIYNKLNEVTTKLTEIEKNAKQGLATQLKNSFRDTLGFEPTIRNIVEIFTVAIEVLMETIYRVSKEAESVDNSDRVSELSSKFITNTSSNNVKTDIKNNSLNENIYYAWPSYREKITDNDSFKDKYLGDVGVLNNPYKVDELVFIDDLLRAIITSQQETTEISNGENTLNVKTWYPVNVFDTNIFQKTEPYLRTSLTTIEDVLRLVVERSFMFISYTNNSKYFSIDNKELKQLAEIEVDSIIRVLKDNKTLIQALSQINLKNFIDVENESNGVNKLITLDTNNKYKYDYPKYNGGKIIFPLSDTFNGEWPNIYELNNEGTLKEKADSGSIFCSNLGPGYYNGKSKIDDGAKYIEILNIDEFKNNVELFEPSNTIDKNNKINYVSLKTKTSEELLSSDGFNCFGGTLGIQEFKDIDYGDSTLDGLPFMYSFYDDGFIGLSDSRNDKMVSNYDFKVNSKINILTSKKGFFIGKNKNKIVERLGMNKLLFKQLLNNDNTITYPYIELRVNNKSPKQYSSDSFSLFGSQFYYNQDKARITFNNSKRSLLNCEKYSKAVLFLQTLPFNLEGNSPDIFQENYILNVFNNLGGFIHAPRLWCAWVGSIIWLTDRTDPVLDNNLNIISGGRGTKLPFIWNYDNAKNNLKFDKPDDTKEYFPTSLTTHNNLLVLYDNINIKYDIIVNLPDSVKNKFKEQFFNFVNGTDNSITFDSIRNELEIWGGSSKDFSDFFLKIRESVVNKDVLDTSLLVNNKHFKNYDKYSIINVIKSLSGLSHYGFVLELKGDVSSNNGVKQLIKALQQEVVIANATPTIWQKNETTYYGEPYLPMRIDKTVLETYFNEFINVLKNKAESFSPTKIKKEAEQEFFGTTDESVIKLILYNTCKNIHDKWLAGVTDENNLIFQCTNTLKINENRNKTDLEVANKYGNTKPRLIDSFRFISRSFKDIGDELYINPTPINNYLIDSPNVSAYDVLGNLFDTNKFTYNALPTFINFRDKENVEAIFDTYPNYTEAVQNGGCGPSFVCVYAGQPSKHLDYFDSDYENDGFDFGCIENNGSINLDPSIPSDFVNDIGGGESPITVFSVKYGQQNQNIFKDINLDQSEFSETDESIQIQDQISKSGSETSRTLAGQNIYNVYSVRSYTAQIEMMGNAMIQPMMYFQLDNIPMFHGAYMITRVKHNIKPNNMMTTFTGTRIRYAETPLLTAMDLYMSLVDTLSTDAAGTGSVAGITYSNGNYNNAVNYKVEENSGLKYQIKDLGGDNYAVSEVGKFMQDLAIQWYELNKNTVYSDTLMVRAFSKFGGGSVSGHSGNSKHNKGLAVDLRPMLKTKKQIAWNVGQYNYSNEQNIKFVQMVIDLANSGKYDLRLDNIIHNNSNLINHFKNIKNSKGGTVVISSDGHDNHIHIEWDAPLKNTSNEKIVSNTTTQTGCPINRSKFNNISGYKDRIESFLNGSSNCLSSRDCKGSIDGFKQISNFYQKGKLTKKGLFAISKAYTEGIGSSPKRHNPGNITTTSNGKVIFATYNTWKDGWLALDKYISEKSINAVTTESRNWVDCYSKESNQFFKNNNIKYKDLNTYNYNGGKPTLRQYVNIYAPWNQNNPTNYITSIVNTYKEYGYNINVDDLLVNII